MENALPGDALASARKRRVTRLALLATARNRLTSRGPSYICAALDDAAGALDRAVHPDRFPLAWDLTQEVLAAIAPFQQLDHYVAAQLEAAGHAELAARVMRDADGPPGLRPLTLWMRLAWLDKLIDVERNGISGVAETLHLVRGLLDTEQEAFICDAAERVARERPDLLDVVSRLLDHVSESIDAYRSLRDWVVFEMFPDAETFADLPEPYHSWAKSEQGVWRQCRLAWVDRMIANLQRSAAPAPGRP